ncbi:hypothetical protein B0H19DRAFT_322450 [Mycena capillaripes]|nr:hypothetical protein B0H19DRAFT_322450 [Mycena capillaripes]
MHLVTVPCLRTAFIFYLFAHLANSAVIVRKPAQSPSAFPTPSPFPVLVGAVGQLSESTTVFTTTSAVSTTGADGKPTTTNLVFTSTQVTLVPVSTTTGETATSKLHSANKLVITVAASVSVGVILLLSALIFFVIARRRRTLRKQTKTSLESPKVTANPFYSELDVNQSRASWTPYIDRAQTRGSTLTASNTVSTRQLYISNQVERARKKMAELEEMSTLLRSTSNASRQESGRPPSYDIPPTTAPVDEPANSSLAVQDRLDRAVREIEGLNNRIRELEQQRSSSWALGQSNELPPGYTE